MSAEEIKWKLARTKKKKKKKTSNNLVDYKNILKNKLNMKIENII